jgi:hypothetical protein
MRILRRMLMPRHELTQQERARGGQRKAERIHQRRAEQERAAAEKLAAHVDEAVEKLVSVMRSDDGAPGARAAVQILDRVLGRPTQRVSGDVEVRRQWEMAGAAEQASAKLDDLIRRRTKKPGHPGHLKKA